MSDNYESLETYVIKIDVKKSDRIRFLSYSVFDYPQEHQIRVDKNFEDYIKRYSNDFERLLRELIRLFEKSSLETEIDESCSKEKLIAYISKLEGDYRNLESINDKLNKKNSDLSKNRVNEEKRKLERRKEELEQKVAQLSNKLSIKQSNITRLESQLVQAKANLRDYESFSRNFRRLFPQDKTLEDVADRLDTLKRDNEKLEGEKEELKTSKQKLTDRLSSLEQELDETCQKLGLAISRVHEVIEKPEGIVGGGSRSDKFKHVFENLKRGLFHETSGKILNSWKKEDSKLTFRSEKFSLIKSILSKSVFIDGMSYFAVDNPEVNTNIKLIMTQLLSVEGLSLNQSILQSIEEKITNILKKTKNVDDTTQKLNEYVEETTVKILADLKEIRDYPLSEEATEGIKEFVQEGLKLVQEVVKDSSSAHFYLPETETEFDETLHDTREKPEGKIKLTICVGYRTKATIFTKADVITYIPDIPNTDTESNGDNAGTSDSSEQSPNEAKDSSTSESPSDQIDDTNSKKEENQNEQPETSVNSDTDDAKDPNSSEQSLDQPDNDNSEKEEEGNSDIGQGDLSTSSQTVTQDSNNDIGRERSPNENGNNSVQPKSEEGIYFESFEGEVKSKELQCYTQPSKNYQHDGPTFKKKQKMRFDAWTYGDEMSYSKNRDKRWYRSEPYSIHDQKFWFPASNIEGEPKNSSPFPLDEKEGGIE